MAESLMGSLGSLDSIAGSIFSESASFSECLSFERKRRRKSYRR